jgi:carbonic anhydrase
MDSYRRLLLANRAWVKDKTAAKPEFFKSLAKEQKPEYLWIGCSDSRVPAEEITGTEPGELFVHRNIANLVIHTDLNLLSVLHFAVEVLRVKHIIVCGHYGCGGVRTAMTGQRVGVLNNWLRHIKDIYYAHKEELARITDDVARTNKLVEINVRAQVYNLAKTHIVQESWHRYGQPMIHGWVYGLEDGLLQQVTTLGAESDLDNIFQYDFTDVPSNDGAPK